MLFVVDDNRRMPHLLLVPSVRVLQPQRLEQQERGSALSSSVACLLACLRVCCFCGAPPLGVAVAEVVPAGEIHSATSRRKERE